MCVCMCAEYYIMNSRWIFDIFNGPSSAMCRSISIFIAKSNWTKIKCYSRHSLSNEICWECNSFSLSLIFFLVLIVIRLVKVNTFTIEKLHTVYLTQINDDDDDDDDKKRSVVYVVVDLHIRDVCESYIDVWNQIKSKCCMCKFIFIAQNCDCNFNIDSWLLSCGCVIGKYHSQTKSISVKSNTRLNTY